MQWSDTKVAAGRAAMRRRRSPGQWLRQADRRALLVAGDAAAAMLAVVTALRLWTLTASQNFDGASFAAQLGWIFVLVPVWLVLNLDLYSPRALASWAATTGRLAANAGVALALYLVLFFVAPRDLLPRLVVVYFVLAAMAYGLAWRRVFVWLLALPVFRQRLIVVGAGWAGEVIAATLAEHRPREYAVVGFIDDDPTRHQQRVAGLPVLGGPSALLPAVRAHGASQVILAIVGELNPNTFQALLECQAQGVPVQRMSLLYELVTGRVPIDHLDADLMVRAFIEGAERSPIFRVGKRVFDVVAGLAGLLALAVVTPLIAAAIRAESRGPVFYGQTRMGQGGRLFTLWKFRTMVPEAEADGRPRWADAKDDRVTRVGRWLRRYRLDEAPQFWNVLRGELSLVGPRPERPEFVAELEKEIPFYRVRHLVKPGLTGWAQVNYGYSATVAAAAVKLQWDLYYIKHRSPWLDIVILLQTVGVVLSGRGT